MVSQKHIGAAPASLIHVGTQRETHVSLQLTHYAPNSIESEEIESIAPLSTLPKEQQTWLEVSGLHEPQVIGDTCDILDIDGLVAEDILNTHSSAKIDDLGDSILCVVKLPSLSKDTNELEIKQVSILLKQNLLVTFTEEQSTLFNPIHKRLRAKNSRMAGQITSYLLWAIIDIIVDHILHFLQTIEDEIEQLDYTISTENKLPELSRIHTVRRNVATVHRAIRPLRDIVSFFEKTDSDLFNDSTAPYFKDLQDHAKQVIEHTEFLRDHAASLRELYYTLTSHRMNEVMKVMAVLSAIFLPLSFVAGVYGMNFANMPELQWQWGYPAILVFFLLLATGLVVLFKKRGWF